MAAPLARCGCGCPPLGARDTPPLYDVTCVVLEGSPRSSDADDQVEVLTGSFSVTTDPVSYGFAATAGQCVTVVEVSDSTPA